MDKQVKVAVITVCVCGCLFMVAVGTVAVMVALRAYHYEKPIGDGSVAALEYINRPCDAKDAKGLLLKPGTICSVNKMTTDIGDIAKAGAIQVQQSGTLIQATAQNLNAVGASVQGVATKFGGTADAATGLLATTKTTVAAAQPLLDNASTLVSNLDTESKPLIGRASLFMADADTFTKTLPPLTANLTTLTGNLDATTGDFQTKFHAFLFPAPCHQFKCHLGEVYNGAVDASKFIQPSLYFKELLFGEQINGTIKVAH